MLRTIVTSFLDLLYPPLCLHCKESIDRDERLLCSQCLLELILIDPIGRCPFCFGESEFAKLTACLDCRHHHPIVDRMAAACNHLGPAATLLKQLKYSNRPYLAKGAGALMAAQFLRMKWPFPDFIVPVPVSFIDLFERGYQSSKLLADVVGSILERPVEDLLQNKGGEYCRRDIEMIIKDKTLLLIDDMPGSSLNSCASLLLIENPKALYGMTFCRAI